MRKLVAAFLLLGLAVVAMGQTTPNFPISLPKNTVLGRLGTGPGPVQAIPFATFGRQTGLGNVRGPTSTTAGHFAIWADTVGTNLADLSPPCTVAYGCTGGVSWTAGAPLLGNGTSALQQGTITGNTTKFATWSGSTTANQCVKIDASGNLAAAGASCGAGNQTATTQDFVAPGGFTPGSTTSLTLSSAPTNEDFLLVTFDGVVQSHNTYSLSSTTLTFAAAIPASVQVVEAQWYAATTSAGVISANGLSGIDVNIQGGTGITVSTSSPNVTISTNIPGVSTPAVSADVKFLNNGSVTSGAAVLTSASSCAPRNCAGFVMGDVGKSIQCTQNGTTGQTVLSTTILSYQSATQVTLSANSSFSATATASCQWGTDQTSTINTAISDMSLGGTVLLPCGYIMVSSVNLTKRASTHLKGCMGGVNNVISNTYPGVGTVLVTTQGTYCIVDTTGSNQLFLEDLQIGSLFSPVTARCGILYAQDNTGSLFAERLMISRVYTTGFCGVGFYAYGAAWGSIRDSKFQCYAANPVGFYVNTNNAASVTSNYATIATGLQVRGGGVLDTVEIHASAQPDVQNSGVGLWSIGHIVIAGRQVSVDAQTSSGAIRIEPDSGSGIAENWSLDSLNVYSEGGAISAFCWAVSSGTFATVWLTNYTGTCTTGVSGNLTQASAFSNPH